jgi:hypothetical protein
MYKKPGWVFEMVWLQCNPELKGATYWDWTLLKWIEQQIESDSIIVIPGAFQADYIDEINRVLMDYKTGVVIITSDEEANFPLDKLKTNLKVYTQYYGHAPIPIGYAPNPPVPLKKTIPYFFAGQVTTPDRMILAQVMRGLDGELVETEGFAQGLKKDDYNAMMGAAKIVPCPGGPFSPDSFRLYEALEAGCTPVVNDEEFFTKLFGHFPFPCVKAWSELKDIEYKDYSGWWDNYKEELVNDLWMLQS